MNVTTAHPVRAEIAKLMADGRERTASDVARQLKIPITLATSHLKVMRDWGLVSSDKSLIPLVWCKAERRGNHVA